MVPAGSVQAEFIFDVSNSMGAQDYRPYLPLPEGMTKPDPSFQWGTRVDAAKYYMTQDLMPQLQNNEAGLITAKSVGYQMWDITRDLSTGGAFNHMLRKAVQVGAAQGKGCDYAAALEAALDEFDLVGKMQKELGDTAEKIRFIVFFTDGYHKGDPAQLDKVLDKLKEKNIHLLMVGMGGGEGMYVSKYDAKSHQANGQFFPGTTALNQSVLTHIQDYMPQSDLIFAPPGAAHIKYSFPQKSGGKYATAGQSNLRPWLLLVNVLLFASITLGGGGLPRWKHSLPNFRAAKIQGAIDFLRSRISNRSQSSKDK
jgi:hypothetical protein